MPNIRLILNGKKAELPAVRNAVTDARTYEPDLSVRVSFEYGDIGRFVEEAHKEGITRLIAGGGDGTANEMVNALMKIEREERPKMGIMPLGTANDFASSCLIPPDPLSALLLAINGKSRPMDVGQANDRYFINVASGGFGAEVTATTPIELKNFLGGNAYALTGLLKALNFVPNQGKMVTEDQVLEGAAVVGAICNGRQAGGGLVLAPDAKIDDGLLDIVIIKYFSALDIPQVLSEIQTPTPDGEFVKIFQTTWIDRYSGERVAPINLDGEPYLSQKIHFKVVPKALDIVLPHSCPLFS